MRVIAVPGLLHIIMCTFGLYLLDCLVACMLRNLSHALLNVTDCIMIVFMLNFVIDCMSVRV